MDKPKHGWSLLWVNPEPEPLSQEKLQATFDAMMAKSHAPADGVLVYGYVNLCLIKNYITPPTQGTQLDLLAGYPEDPTSEHDEDEDEDEDGGC